MDAFDVLQEFVNDVEGAYPSGRDVNDLNQDDCEVDEEKLNWPDLMVTYHHANQVLARSATFKTDICTLRKIIDRIAEKFGKSAYVEFCEDGSGLIGDKLVDDDKYIVVEFDGLGELSTILAT